MHANARWMNAVAAGTIMLGLVACSAPDAGTDDSAPASGPKQVTLQTVAPSDAKAAQLKADLEKAGFKVDGIVQWPANSYKGWPKHSYEAVVTFTPNCKQTLGIAEEPKIGLEVGDTAGTILTAPPSSEQLKDICG